ncbi:uncharacterized protein LOC130777631 isoform X2 [Actinidia eriantha]|uniref:uncharacterized protein LOC130777631 isoform X2 n=1 Tax=Actinidia eriantha TaxID=165200 RepID=UPI00258A6B52|nr:uncharacterized protein LOC130777631 isoform X2 [Actinidia eriantha]
MERIRCKELALSSLFCSTIYSEIEEVGWEHLVRLGEDLTFLSFRILFVYLLHSGSDSDIVLLSARDKNERLRILEIQVDETYPKNPPSVSADLPHMFNLNWSIKSRLKDVVYQFQQHLMKLQEFWSTLDCIDQSLWVVDPKQAHHATSHRLINIGNDCQLMLFIDPVDPTSLPECRFIGSDPKVNSLRQIWKRNCKRWMKNKPLAENLAITLEIQLPGPPDVQKNDQQVECGICYAQCLPIDDELGAKSGSGTDYTCDNGNCSRAFHSLCLGDWLRSITTTRQYGHSMFCLGIVRIVQSRLQ